MGSDPLACSHTHLRRRPPWLVCARGIASTPLLLAANSPRYLPMKTIAFVLGALLIVVAVIYLTVPADSLPSFLPGHEVGLAPAHEARDGRGRRHPPGGRLGSRGAARRRAAVSLHGRTRSHP